MNHKKIKQAGFTMIELVVAMVVVGVLAAIAIPKYVSLSSEANAAKAAGNSDTLQVAYQAFMAERAASDTANMFPSLAQIVGASGDWGLPAIPSGWSNGSTPPATTGTVHINVGTTEYAGTATGGVIWTIPWVDGAPNASDPAVVADAICVTHGGHLLDWPNFQATYGTFRCVSAPFDQIVYGGGNFIGSYDVGRFAEYSCPTGGTAGTAPNQGTCTKPGTDVCPTGYTKSGATCNLTDAAAVSCPSGYSMVSGSCSLPPISGGSPQPHAIDFSGFCVAVGMKLPAWKDMERTIPTAAADDIVKALDATPVADAVNCPDSLFQG